MRCRNGPGRTRRLSAVPCSTQVRTLQLPITIWCNKVIYFSDHLELLERGELKFTYEDADNFGDSCGSAESGEGSDTEPENEVESALDGESQFYDIGSVETEPEDDYEVDVSCNNFP